MNPHKARKREMLIKQAYENYLNTKLTGINEREAYLEYAKQVKIGEHYNIDTRKVEQEILTKFKDKLKDKLEQGT